MNTTEEWSNPVRASDGRYHVLPIADLIAHEADTDCVCGPTCLPVVSNGTVTGFTYSHNALDGRK